MLLILANRSDYSARVLSGAWAQKDALLITPRNLSEPGWKLQDDPRGLTAVVGGRVVDARDISGVLTRMPCVGEAELFDVIPADRRFVAAEMTAFLFAWLTRLDCPVVNIPSPTCLSGPFWRHERWLRAASEAGIPIDSFHRDTRSPASPWRAPPSPNAVTVVASRCFGDVDSSLKQQARRLAQTAGVDLLSVEFSDASRGARFMRTNMWPDLSRPEVGAALAEHFETLTRRRKSVLAS